jgi:hypothetical protein
MLSKARQKVIIHKNGRRRNYRLVDYNFLILIIDGVVSGYNGPKSICLNVCISVKWVEKYVEVCLGEISEW